MKCPLCKEEIEKGHFGEDLQRIDLCNDDCYIMRTSYDLVWAVGEGKLWQVFSDGDSQNILEIKSEFFKEFLKNKVTAMRREIRRYERAIEKVGKIHE